MRASLLLHGDSPMVANGFIQSRPQDRGHFLYGSMPKGIDCEAIIACATPVLSLECEGHG